MVFIPEQHYLWDFWLVSPHEWGDARAPYHLYYRQAWRRFGSPNLRHGAATVGHAISHDLRQWVSRGTALEAGRPGSWDDRAIWTGSVTVRDGLTYMFYTGLCQAERGLVQRIGLAVSTDLVLPSQMTWYTGNETRAIRCSRSTLAGTSRRAPSKRRHRRGTILTSCTPQMRRYTICSCPRASMQAPTMDSA